MGLKQQHRKFKGQNFRTAPYLIMHVHLTGDTLKNKAPYMDVWGCAEIFPDSVIFTRKRKEKTYRRDPFQGKDIFLLLRIGCYHGAKLFANYTRLNPPFSTFLSDGDKEYTLYMNITLLRHVFS